MTHPGTISDKVITEQCEVIDKRKRIITDKGFDIADLCYHKRLLHNHSPLQFDSQSEQTDISNNFEITTLMIYNESFIGRMRPDYLECLLFIRSSRRSYYKILLIAKENSILIAQSKLV